MAPPSSPVDEPAEAGTAVGAGRPVGGGTEEQTGDLRGPRAAQPHAAHAATSRRRGHGDDGLAEVVHIVWNRGLVPKGGFGDGLIQNSKLPGSCTRAICT